jgi:predicted SAM-dependent methyltransferase
VKKKWFHSVIIDDYLEAFTAFKKLRREAESKRVLFENNMLKINSLINSGTKIKVEFGAGKNRGSEGWTYVDMVHGCDLVLDLTQHLLFPDNCVTEIYSSHLLEHFTYRELMCFLKECHRILVPGGKFNAAVPNARLYLQSYCDNASVDVRAMCGHAKALNGDTKIDFINYIAYMDGVHRYMFDEENLVEAAKVAGFSKVRIRDFDEAIDMIDREAISLYVLAEK